MVWRLSTCHTLYFNMLMPISDLKAKQIIQVQQLSHSFPLCFLYLECAKICSAFKNYLKTKAKFEVRIVFAPSSISRMTSQYYSQAFPLHFDWSINPILCLLINLKLASRSDHSAFASLKVGTGFSYCLRPVFCRNSWNDWNRYWVFQLYRLDHHPFWQSKFK